MFRSIEISVGMFVGAGLAALFMLAMQASNLSSLSSDGFYEVTARFDNIGGLRVRSAVKVSGVKVKKVKSIKQEGSRPKLVEIEGTEITLNDFDQVIFAIGNRSEYPKTETKGIFNAGDFEHGSSTVVEAVAVRYDRLAAVAGILPRKPVE